MKNSRKNSVNSWSKEQACRLIEEIQKHPLLYDQMHPLYQHRSHRFAALRLVIEKLKPIKPNVNAEMISRKMKVLRHQYYKEKNTVEYPPESLLDDAGNYQPRLWCYELMKFLSKRRRYTATEPPPTCLRKEPEEIESQEMEEDNCLTEEEYNHPFEKVEIERLDHHMKTPTQKFYPPKSALHNKCLTLVETLSKKIGNTEAPPSTNAILSTQQSPKTFLGLMVESELSGVSEEIYHDAKWKIIHILEEATTKEREKNMQGGEVNSTPSTTTFTSNLNAANNVDGQKKVTVLGSCYFKTPT